MGEGGLHKPKPCNENIQRTIDLTQKMMALADQGDADREDTGCGILYGMLRDAAYKLRQMAEKEKKQHQAKGWWSRPARAGSNRKETSSLASKPHQ